MWKMLKDDVDFYKWFYKEVSFSTFITHVVKQIFAYIPLLLYYAFIAGLAVYFANRVWRQLVEPLELGAILKSPLNLFLFAVCAFVIIAFRRVWVSLAGALWHGLCIFALATAFLYFLIVNPLGLVLFIFLLLH